MIRVGFSSRAFIGMNENDAKAATKVWALTIAKERQVNVDPVAKVFRSAGEIENSFREKAVDCVTMSAVEYFALDPQLQPQVIVSLETEPSEEYLLLVQKDSGISDLSGLRGKAVNLHDSFRTNLALAWLDTIFMQQGYGPANKFAAKVQPFPKPSSAVLPVFFRQADACLVSSGAFGTMVEMNPQLGKQLRLLAQSPRYLSAFLGFRRDLPPGIRIPFQSAVYDLHKSAAGAQIIALFQGTGGLVEKPLSVLDNARELLSQHARLLRKQSAGSTGDSTTP